MVKKTASRASARRSSRNKLLEAPRGGIVVRMYRQGLGDCFLLGISGDQRRKRKTRYVLIDCGVHSRQKAGAARLAEVMDDIVAATGGELDVIVATHEHADHLSGFVQKNSPFLTGKIKKVGQLWLGWTEKVGDPQADRLRKKRGTARSVIEKVLDDITAKNRPTLDDQSRLAFRIRRFKDFEVHPDDSLDDKSIMKQIDALCETRSDSPRARANVEALNLAADDAGFGSSLAAAGSKRKKPTKNELALGILAAQAEEAVYAEPGNVLKIPYVKQARAYVLAPPRDEKLLKKDQPSKIRKSDREDSSGSHDDGIYKEVYLSGGARASALMYAPALGDDLPFRVEPDFPKDEMRFPFHDDHRHGFCQGNLQARNKDREIPPGITALLDETYLKTGAGWRQIEDDWLEGCEDLALNLDSDTNNTSLVLAFELGDPGKGQVLLFTGDAQVGNWLSWRRQEYKSGDVTMTADDLLRRTTLYKVGHHASHNATGRRDSTDVTDAHPLGVPFGLELMDNIIAMIPVDRKAAQKNRPWEMPYTPLYRRLRERSRRRVLRSDQSLEPLKSPSEKKDLKPTTRWSRTPGIDGARWRAARKKFSAAPDTPLYYDVEFKPPHS